MGKRRCHGAFTTAADTPLMHFPIRSCCNCYVRRSSMSDSELALAGIRALAHQGDSPMLATDVGDFHIVVAAPHRHGGVASMLVALGNANVDVSHIEPPVDGSGIYRLTVGDDPHLAIAILEGIGWRVSTALTTRARADFSSSPPLNPG